MTALSAKERVQLAEAELEVARAALARDTRPISASLRRHRGAWIVGGGLIGGFALSWLPTRMWAKIGAVVGGGSALVARSLLTPMIAGALLSRQQQNEAATSGDTSDD